MESPSIQLYTTSQDAWDAMYDALEHATTSIYWEVYIFVDDAVGARFIRLLENKARNGCTVKLLVDGLGSAGLSKDATERMKQAGVDIVFFSARHAKKIRTRWQRLWTRSHRKVLVIDERIGFIGGVNVEQSMSDWHDIHVQIVGNAVHSLLRSFAKHYIIAGGTRSNVSHLLKYKHRIASRQQPTLEFIYDEPGTLRSKARRRYVEAFRNARERVILFSPYYFPDRTFLKELWRARKRGIQIDLVIPFRSDIRIATYAAYALFSLMHRRGVHVHMTASMMHGKGVIVDDQWAMIGSSNIDQTSFYDNYEANVRLNDKPIVAELTRTIEQWIASSKKLVGAEWQQRGIFTKIKERISIALYRLWYRGHERLDTIKQQSRTKKSRQSK